MRIGCLQFAPELGDVNHNLTRADLVLAKANPQKLDLLVLPELAFSGEFLAVLSTLLSFESRWQQCGGYKNGPHCSLNPQMNIVLTAIAI